MNLIIKKGKKTKGYDIVWFSVHGDYITFKLAGQNQNSDVCLDGREVEVYDKRRRVYTNKDLPEERWIWFAVVPPTFLVAFPFLLFLLFSWLIE